jgi:hypothetical protein
MLAMDAEPTVDKEQAVAGIRILTHLARVDGRVSEAERKALTPSIEALGANAEALFEEEVELDVALEAVTDPAVRRAVIRAAYAVAQADGTVPEELAVIEAARRAWPAESEDPELERDLAREDHRRVPDPEERAQHVERLVATWTFGVASLALSADEIQSRWRGRQTDIHALTRRFIRGEITADELAYKFKEDIGEA